MQTTIRLALLALAGVSATLLLLGGKATPKSDPIHDQAARVERGRYLVAYGGCAECHTPSKLGPNGFQPDPARFMSGHPADLQLPPPPANAGPWMAQSAGLTAWAGPWGVSYAANLTPEPLTGLGIWTEQMFVKAMRTGRHMGSGRDIMPPMPYQAVQKLNDADLKAIYAYLRSLPPIRNRVPDPVRPDSLVSLD